MVSYQKALVYTRLHSSEIHIWQLPLEDSDSAQMSSLLSEDEKGRAARFVFDKDRRFFIACRVTLRTLLESYLEQPAADLRFTYSERGKPQLSSAADLRFNVSHSGGLALFAFTRGCELGVDVEHVRPVKEIDNIAERFFCPDECAQLISLPDVEKPGAFFRCWTRKEAYVKATGDGLSAPLDQFQVTFGIDESARFIHINRDVQQASRWTLQHLGLDSPYVGAVAYESAPKEIRFQS